MPETKKLLIGVGASIAVSTVWEIIPQHNQYKLASLQGNPLAIFEHYHFGLASLIVAYHTKNAKPYLQGLGVGLIATEAGQENPFGIGKPTVGASIVLGIALTALLALSL